MFIDFTKNFECHVFVCVLLQDGFVLVGSVAGQRYWSSMLNLDSIITCGIWTPDDQQVYFGTAHGQIIVMDVHGAMVSQVQLYADMKITSMAWSCEKFKMEEGEDDPGVTNAGTLNHAKKKKKKTQNQTIPFVIQCQDNIYNQMSQNIQFPNRQTKFCVSG